MQGVVNALGRADENDVSVLAAYINRCRVRPRPNSRRRRLASLERAKLGALPPGRPSTPTPGKNAEWILKLGASIYAGACARCHDASRETGSGEVLQLPLGVAVYEPDPRSLICIIREEISPATGDCGRWMRGFAGALTDEQLVALLTNLGRYAADAAPWPDVVTAAEKVSGP